MTSSETRRPRPGSREPPALLPPWHTPEREKLQEQARRFAMDEVLPVANELDPQKGEIPASLLARLAELGYFGITVPAEQGGLGLGVFEYCMVSEELARAWMSTASILARSQGLGTAVADADRRHELLARSARGDWIGAIALSEPDAGSDLAGVSTRAVLDGDEWVVTGHKRWCGNAKAADFIQVLVRERDPEEGESRSAGPGQPAAGEGARRVPGGADRLSDRQGRLPRLPHLGPDLRRRPHPEGQRHRPGQGRAGGQRRGGRGRQAGRLRRGAEVPQHRPRAHRRPRRRAGPRRAGGLDPLPAGARAVRPPDRRLPGAAVRRRRDGRADRAVAGLLPAGRAPARPRRCPAPRRRRWSSSRPPRCRCG